MGTFIYFCSFFYLLCRYVRQYVARLNPPLRPPPQAPLPLLPRRIKTQSVCDAYSYFFFAHTKMPPSVHSSGSVMMHM